MRWILGLTLALPALLAGCRNAEDAQRGEGPRGGMLSDGPGEPASEEPPREPRLRPVPPGTNVPPLSQQEAQSRVGEEDVPPPSPSPLPEAPQGPEAGEEATRRAEDPRPKEAWLASVQEELEHARDRIEDVRARLGAFSPALQRDLQRRLLRIDGERQALQRRVHRVEVSTGDWSRPRQETEEALRKLQEALSALEQEVTTARRADPPTQREGTMRSYSLTAPPRTVTATS